jgi:imidazolonepropionase-like amidohydrolase
MKRLGLPLVLLAVSAVAAADDSLVLRGGRVVTVSGPAIENGTVLVKGGKIVAVGRDVAVPPGAAVIDTSGKVVYPGLIDGLTTLGLAEIESVPGSVDAREVGDVNPHAKAWVALNPHSELIPVARANGVTAALTAPLGGLIAGQSAVIRLAGSTPDALTVKTPAAMQMAYPTGRPPFDITALFEEPERKPFEEREREKKENQEKDLDRLRNLLEDAKAYGGALAAAASGKATPPKPDPVLEALAPAARGELPVIFHADTEGELRATVAFAEARGLKLILAGGLEAWRCAALLKEKDVPVLIKVLRLPRRRSDPYDSAYANAAVLAGAGVRFDGGSSASQVHPGHIHVREFYGTSQTSATACSDRTARCAGSRPVRRRSSTFTASPGVSSSCGT